MTTYYFNIRTFAIYTMPNGIPPGPMVPQFPVPTSTAQRPGFLAGAPRQLAPELQDLQKKISELVSDLGSRVKLIEERVENLRNHLDIIDSSLIEKHKAVISEIRNVEDGQRALRADMDMLKELAERLAKRMEALASKEEVKVLDRYVQLWQPLNFITRAEVTGVVKSVLKAQGIKIKEE